MRRTHIDISVCKFTHWMAKTSEWFIYLCLFNLRPRGLSTQNLGFCSGFRTFAGKLSST